MTEKTLVFGASIKSNRYSNLVIHRLVNNGINVVAYGIEGGEVSGIKIDNKLLNYSEVKTVSLYLNPARQNAYYDYIVSLKPNRVIFNPGTENQEFYNILRTNNIDFEVACTLTLLATNQY